MSKATFVFAEYEGNNPGPVMDELFRNVQGALVPNVAAVAGRSVGRGNERRLAALSSPKPDFAGKSYVPELDRTRLKAQLVRVRELMRDGKKRSLAEIAQITGDPESSVSARLRDLRKPKNGLWTVNRQRRSPNQYEYWIGGKGL